MAPTFGAFLETQGQSGWREGRSSSPSSKKGTLLGARKEQWQQQVAQLQSLPCAAGGRTVPVYDEQLPWGVATDPVSSLAVAPSAAPGHFLLPAQLPSCWWLLLSPQDPPEAGELGQPRVCSSQLEENRQRGAAFRGVM